MKIDQMDKIVLPSIEIGLSKVKYFDTAKFKLQIDKCRDTAGEILFVGNDILKAVSSKCHPKNYHRVFDRLKKRGWATKVSIYGAKIEGVVFSTGIWMCNIHALFHLAFENHSTDVQKYLLTHYTEMWLSSCGKEQLPPTIDANFDSYNKTNLTRVWTDLSTSSGHLQPGTECTEKSCIEFPSSESEHQIEQEYSADTHLSDDPASQSYFVGYTSEGTRAGCPVSRDSPPFHSKKSQCNHVCNPANVTDGHAPRDGPPCNTAQEETFLSAVSGFITNIGQLFLNDAILVHDVFESVIRFLDDYNSYLGENLNKDFESEFDISSKENRFLCFVSEWLGQRYNLLKPNIIDKSEFFKRRHISCIDNLPTAQEIVQEIFPQCMVVLLRHWMEKGRLSESAGDHSYCDSTPPQNMRATSYHDSTPPQSVRATSYHDSTPPQNVRATSYHDSTPPQSVRVTSSRDSTPPQSVRVTSSCDSTTPQNVRVTSSCDSTPPQSVSTSSCYNTTPHTRTSEYCEGTQPKNRRADNCDVTPPKKMRRTVSESGGESIETCVYSEQIFSFVQFVLEFTNNCLISGVAHVVYPRLLESPS